MNIIITGAQGQLGQAIASRLGEDSVIAVDLPEIDIADPKGVGALVRSDVRLVINCAAYTNVDGCVSDYEAAYRANAVGPMVLANACREADVPLVHISSNEVFDGSLESGYEEWMALNPINPYGRTKAAGETYVRSLCPKHFIIRTAWLMAPGGKNFVHAILKRARSGQDLRVVADEIGNPTLVSDLVKALLEVVEIGQYGTYHLTNAGSCSRWEFANEILRLAGIEGIKNERILSAAYERPSSPPPFGALRNCNAAALGVSLRPWEEALADFVGDLADEDLPPAPR